MTEFAKGGLIERSGELFPLVFGGCDYIIPDARAGQRFRELLDHIEAKRDER